MGSENYKAMKLRALYLVIVLVVCGGRVYGQQAPGRPKVVELPIGKLVTWRAEPVGQKFFIQRSDDGIYYRTVGTVAVSDSLRNHYYSYLDASLSSDEVYYRIAQAGHDTGIEYSEAFFFCGGMPNNVALRRISDSQADKVIVVEFESAKNQDGKYEIQTDIQEHTFTIYEKPIKVLKGRNILPIDVRFLDPGFYQVYLTVGPEREKFSFVKKPSKAEGDIITVKK